MAARLAIDPSSIVTDFPIDGPRVLKNLASFDLAKLNRGDRTGIDEPRLSFRCESVYAMSLADGEADVVMSNAFLEHIPDVERGIREIARITKVGGLSVHNIDLTDHRRYGGGAGPLDFLMESSSEPIVHHSNRVRLSQFTELFQRNGFQIVQQIVHHRLEVPQSLRARFVEPFRSLSQEDLEAGMVRFTARRLP